jgi:hypothetical protein
MMAENVAHSTACKDLFPIVDMVHALARSVGLSVDDVFNMHLKINQNNVGFLTLAFLAQSIMQLSITSFASMPISIMSSQLKLPLQISMVFCSPRAFLGLPSLVCNPCSWAGIQYLHFEREWYHF